MLIDLFELNAVDEMICKQLLTTHKATVVFTFQNELMLVLSINGYVVVYDFTENYSFILCDEVRSFHWNNAEAHFVIYFSKIYIYICHICLFSALVT